METKLQIVGSLKVINTQLIY